MASGNRMYSAHCVSPLTELGIPCGTVFGPDRHEGEVLGALLEHAEATGHARYQRGTYWDFFVQFAEDHQPDRA